MLPDPLFGSVHMYGIMVAVGVLACFAVLFRFGRKNRMPEKMLDFIFYTGIAAVALGFGAAAVCQSFYNWLEHPEYGFRFDGGITFIGGLAGGILCFLLSYAIFRKKLPARLWDGLPLMSCCVVIAHGFGRIGCFFAGCCYGKHTGTFLDVHFPEIPETVLPTQLYEAAFLFLLFALFAWMYLKKKSGLIFPVYLMSYGAFRFAIEFLRGDDRGTFIGALSPSQFWSAVMILAGAAAWFLVKKYPPTVAWPEPVPAPEATEMPAEPEANLSDSTDETEK